MAKPFFIKNCNYCGSEFETTNDRQLYCNSTCRSYNSLEKSGKASEQMKTRKTRITKYAKKSKSNPQNRKPQPRNLPLLTRLLKSHIESYFSVDSIHDTNIYTANTNDKLIDKYGSEAIINPYEDIPWKVKRVTPTPMGDFVVTSVSKYVIDQIKEVFEGSKIFTGSTQERLIKEAVRPDIFDYPDEEREEMIRSGARYSITTYSTIVKRENVIDKSGIDISSF